MHKLIERGLYWLSNAHGHEDMRIRDARLLVQCMNARVNAGYFAGPSTHLAVMLAHSARLQGR